MSDLLEKKDLGTLARQLLLSKHTEEFVRALLEKLLHADVVSADDLLQLTHWELEQKLDKLAVFNVGEMACVITIREFFEEDRNRLVEHTHSHEEFGNWPSSRGNANINKMCDLRCLDTYINIKTCDSRSRTPPDRSRNSSTFRGHPSSQPRAPLKKHSRERFRKIFSIENHTSDSGNSLANRHKTRPVMVPWRLPTSFNNKQKCKPSALWAAIERWDLKAVSGLLIAQADPEEKHQGWTPLMKASELGSPNIQKLLLDRAADLEAVNKKGRSALSFAVAPSNNIVPCRESIRLLLERRADVFRKDLDGLTPKEHAIKQGRVGAIIICLEQYE